MSKIHPAIRVTLYFLAIVFSIWFVLFLLNLIPWAPAYPGENPMRIEPGSAPHIVPHGGAKLLYPENTILSYRRMEENGWDTFEVDLVLTSDGQLISHHDLDILSSTGLADTLVRDKSYRELTLLNFGVNFINLDGEQPYADAGEPGFDPELRAELVPARLEELFILYPDNFYILELKDTVDASGQTWADQAVEELVRLIDAYDMQENVVMSSFDDGVTSAFRDRSNNRIPTGAATMDTLILSVLSAVGLDFFLRPQYSAVMLPIRDQIYPSERALIERLPRGLRNRLSSYDAATDTLFTNLANRRMVRDAHRKNLAVYYWTVNDPEDMEFLIDLGVDGIITDRPDLLTAILADRGFSVSGD